MRRTVGLLAMSALMAVFATARGLAETYELEAFDEGEEAPEFDPEEQDLCGPGCISKYGEEREIGGKSCTYHHCKFKTAKIVQCYFLCKPGGNN